MCRKNRRLSTLQPKCRRKSPRRSEKFRRLRPQRRRPNLNPYLRSRLQLRLSSSHQRLCAQWPLPLPRPQGQRRRRAGWCRRASGSESKNPARQEHPRCPPCRLVRLVRVYVRRTRSCRPVQLPHCPRRRETSRDRVDLAAALAASRRAQLRNVRPIRRRCGRTCRRADRGRYRPSPFVRRRARKACAPQVASASSVLVHHDSRPRRCGRR